MRYADGRLAILGDHVDLGGDMSGIVVVSLDDAQASPRFPIDDWRSLRSGILVESEQAGLVHFEKSDVDLVLIKRAE